MSGTHYPRFDTDHYDKIREETSRRYRKWIDGFRCYGRELSDRCKESQYNEFLQEVEAEAERNASVESATEITESFKIHGIYTYYGNKSMERYLIENSPEYTDQFHKWRERAVIAKGRFVLDDAEKALRMATENYERACKLYYRSQLEQRGHA